jgi:hypothetical protein
MVSESSVPFHALLTQFMVGKVFQWEWVRAPDLSLRISLVIPVMYEYKFK